MKNARVAIRIEFENEQSPVVLDSEFVVLVVRFAVAPVQESRVSPDAYT
jgi:hypothetical protein